MARTLPNLGIRGAFSDNEWNWGSDMNTNLLKLSVLVQGTVTNKVSATPSPGGNSVYIFSETHPTQPNVVAVYENSTWTYLTPTTGWQLYNLATNYYEYFNGTVWTQNFSNFADRSIVDVFTSDGTWTKRPGLTHVRAIVIGGGGGGGSGRKGAAGSARSGGGGAGGGALSELHIPAALLGSTESIKVGLGGDGGASVTTDSTNGNAGVTGGISWFGAHVYARGGSNGSPGAAANIAAGFSAGGVFPGGGGGPTSVTATPATASSIGTFAATGGGGGGSISTGNAVLTPGIGGSQTAGASFNGGSAGATGAAGGDGQGSSGSDYRPRGGAGGGGGGASTTGDAGPGGLGGLYGAGGGGGGAATDGVGNSGAGGNGAQGIVIVFNYF